MRNSAQHRNWIRNLRFRPATAALAISIVFALTVAVTQSAQAQTFQVLHNFTGTLDGAYPWFGLAIDAAGGHLYGTTRHGGNPGCSDLSGNGCGTVFRLTIKNSKWIFTTLYDFQGGNDGGQPMAALVFGPDGSPYGTTLVGGGNGCYTGNGCGTVFKLTPPATFCRTVSCPWTETVLHRFTDVPDGGQPASNPIFDRAGNLYGTTMQGGTAGVGAVYSLSPTNGGWAETILYSFVGPNDGQSPWGNLLFDNAGNLYGTTAAGGLNLNNCGYGCGGVFELSPSPSGWIETTLHLFDGDDGYFPSAGLVADSAGNLYGDTNSGGGQYGSGAGTVFALTPSGGSWAFSSIHSFVGYIQQGPWGNLATDQAGNLYGTARDGGLYGAGTVFKLTPSAGGWVYSSLHDFTGYGDGGGPYSNIVFDAMGNLYGVAVSGGTDGDGVVWEITP